jgi:TonB-linked SusC/RagA family outer membrane protein
MNKKVHLYFGLVCWMLFSVAWMELSAQDRSISGRITSADDGSPIPGVSVLIKGTSSGTVSDIDGKYTINASENSVLIFTSVGMESQEITVGAQTSLDVVMKTSATSLEQVVVTALGIEQDTKGLTYSVAQVKGDEIAETQRNNFLISLQGRVPGLNMTPTSGTPGASTAVVLRGANSIGGNNSPLFVIDGLPVDNRTFNQGGLWTDGPNRGNDYLNRIADLNPNDIESVTVLKGMEAAALYGLEASGGAIIITTKKGKAGKAKINYDNSFRFDQSYRFLETQKVFGRGLNGNNETNALRFFGARFPSETKFFNNTENFFQTGKTQNHNLSFEGGSEIVSFRASASYTDQTGVVPTSSMEKFSLRTSATVRFSPKLEATTSFNYIDTKLSKPLRGDNGFYTGLYLWPANEDVNNFLNLNGTRRRLITDNLELDNPLFSLNKNKNNDRTKRSIINASITYRPLSWLDITARLGSDTYSTLGNFFQHPETNQGLGRRGFIENYTENSSLLNAMLLGTITKKFGDFTASLLLGTTVDDRRYEVTSNYGENLFIIDFNSLNNTAPSTRRNKLTITRQRLLSALGSFDLNYKEMVYLKITGRNDWTSTLPLRNNDFFYPSVGLTFVFSELDFFKDRVPFLSIGKVRGTYTEVGKDAPPYRTLPSLVAQLSTGGGFQLGFFGGNQNLKPERGRGFEIGTELGFFNNRLGFEFNYFKNERAQQIVSQRLSYGTGFIFGLFNGGTFINQGIEIQLKGSPIITKDFKWDVTVNFTRNNVEVESLPAGVAEYYNSDTWLFGNARASAFVPNLADFYPTLNLANNRVGAGSATAIGGHSYLRNNKGQVLISPATGLPLINTNFLPIGDRNPDFNVGIINQFQYKDFTLSFLLDIRVGGDVFNGNEMFLFRNGLSTKTVNREEPVIFPGVLQDGRENTDNPTVNTIQVIPQTRATDYYNGIPESEYVEKDINWVRLRDITLSYQLPKRILTRTKIFDNASVYVTGTDLFLITNYTGVDPSINGTTATSLGVGAAGFDYGTLAIPRSISFGIRLGIKP